MHRIRMLTGLVVFGLSAAGCAYTTTAKDWNGLHGADGQPTYYTSTMKVGLNLLCAIPFLGDMGISGLTTDLTGDIKQAGGNEVRIVQGTSEAYFYGFPPFTWVITPVISTVAAEYHPDPATYAKDQVEIERWRGRGWWSKWYRPWDW